MALPSEQRLRNLERNVGGIKEATYYSSVTDDKVFHGVIQEIVPLTEVVTDVWAGGFLKVVYSGPIDMQQDGAVPFECQQNHPLEGVTGSAPYVRVVPLNVDQFHLKVHFRVGEKIKFWSYTAPGESRESVNGTFVTLVEDSSFLAKLTYDSTETDEYGGETFHLYSFRAYQYDATQNGIENKWVLSSPAYVGKCHYMADILNGSTSVLSQQVVRVYRFVKDKPKFAAEEDPEDTYEYWFETFGSGGGGTSRELVQIIGPRTKPGHYNALVWNRASGSIDSSETTFTAGDMGSNSGEEVTVRSSFEHDTDLHGISDDGDVVLYWAEDSGQTDSDQDNCRVLDLIAGIPIADTCINSETT